MYWRIIGGRKGRLNAGLFAFSGLMPRHHATAIMQRRSFNFLRRDIVIANPGSNIHVGDSASIAGWL
ncbi:hypothetical protein [Mesorhizobium loti]|uniref:Uncharacterized protein n=1 Tax=Mesorhizobium loti R88b TaxID=935548 RepID=A0A6M7WID3_RHILI|nr:hypothetical protein [Mesorhizobium loti]QKD01516.1 hypothetical protein EB235_08305 [Mesorhizobium loti R88b]